MGKRILVKFLLLSCRDIQIVEIKESQNDEEETLLKVNNAHLHLANFTMKRH
jgi:hypothetical protein